MASVTGTPRNHSAKAALFTSTIVRKLRMLRGREVNWYDQGSEVERYARWHFHHLERSSAVMTLAVMREMFLT
jgi:hypothetical protein